MLERSYNALAVIIICLVVVLGVIYINFNNFSSLWMPTGKAISSESYCEEVEVPYTDVEEFTEEVAVQNCTEESVKYSAENFKIISECLVSDESNCVKKNVYFSIDFQNIDDAGGTWVLRFSLIGDESIISSKTQTVDLNSGEATRLSVTFPLINEDASKIVSGEYRIEDEANKKICTGSTVMKNVTKTISVTKFRTEVKCF